jgi:sec-independent protein translocase protein TatA
MTCPEFHGSGNRKWPVPVDIRLLTTGNQPLLPERCDNIATDSLTGDESSCAAQTFENRFAICGLSEISFQIENQIRRITMFGGFGMTELLVILVIVIMLFGTKKLRNMGGDLGSAIKGFKKAMSADEEQTKALEDNGQETLSGINTKSVNSDPVNSDPVKSEPDKQN